MSKYSIFLPELIAHRTGTRIHDVEADSMLVDSTGALVFTLEKRTIMAYAPGSWLFATRMAANATVSDNG